MSLIEEKKKLQCEELMLDGLNCPVCAAKIVKKVERIAGVDGVDYNTVTGILNIKSSYKSDYSIKNRVQEVVDGIEPGVIVRMRNGKNMESHKHRTSQSEKKYEEKIKDKHKYHSNTPFKNKYIRRLGIGSLFFVIALISEFIPADLILLPRWLILILFVSSYIIIGGQVVSSSINNILRGQVFDEKFLMTVATLGAFVIGEFPEAVAVMLFYMLGEFLQDKAIDRSRRSIKELMDIKPDYANLFIDNRIKKVDPEEVQTGDIIIIKPGEKVPIDGVVIEGETMVDTSALTGESVSRKIEAGDDVLSGMINNNGLIKVETTKIYSDSTISRILELVENASSKKSKTEEFITKFARYYTPAVVFSALAVAVFPPLFLKGAVFSDWLYRALVFLVISCPCALVISIPLGFFAGIGRASRQGILIKGGNYLEALRKVEKIVFDKTGTLTRGKFKVNKITAVNNHSKKEVLEMAAIAESHSNHPIADSIKKKAGEKINNEIIQSYEEISGHGVKVKTADKIIIAGSNKLMKDEGINFKSVLEEGTVVYVAANSEMVGYIEITDRIKEDAFSALIALRKIGIQKLFMLTGDRDEVADRVAKKLKMDKYFAQLLPAGKVKKMEEIISVTEGNGRVAFVGDGINDAPVLARSDIGIAMGGLGSDAAIEAADIVLMTDELQKLPEAIQIARRTGIIIWQNIILVFAVKSVVLIMGALGVASMWSAVFADVGVALLAVLNSLRILNTRIKS